VRDENLPPSLLGSGRRIGAGPGLQCLIVLVAGLCVVLMVSPVLIATLSMVLDVQIAPWLTRLKVIPVLEAGRVLVTVGLVTRVIGTRELE
jgi:hypothetical protein